MLVAAAFSDSVASWQSAVVAAAWSSVVGPVEDSLAGLVAVSAEAEAAPVGPDSAEEGAAAELGLARSGLPS